MRVSVTNIAYVCLLWAFVMLGTFVYALAAGSHLVGPLGGALVLTLVAAVVGFRVGARNRDRRNDSGIAIEGANIWAEPLLRTQVDRYLSTYRASRRPNVSTIEAPVHRDRQAA